MAETGGSQGGLTGGETRVLGEEKREQTGGTTLAILSREGGIMVLGGGLEV